MFALIRKKILDLYHRYSAISYCTSFSYKPVFDTEKRTGNETDKNAYAFKLPDHRNEIHDASNQLDSNKQFLNLTLENVNDFSQVVYSQSKSVENVLQNKEKSSLELIDNYNTTTTTTTNNNNNNNNKRLRGNKNKTIEILGLHEKQIFLGMISMQYKAKIVSTKTLFHVYSIRSLFLN